MITSALPSSLIPAERSCQGCNSSKGAKRLYEWYGLDRWDDLPRVAEGKCLKLLYSLHAQRSTPEKTPESLCSMFDLGTKCQVPGKLTVYCSEGIYTKV